LALNLSAMVAVAIISIISFIEKSLLNPAKKRLEKL
jgi:hypothetical protein